MSLIPKEVIQQLIREHDFQTSDDVLITLRQMFKEVLQETMEAEIETALGYGKYDLENKSNANKRNGYSKKKVKSQVGEIELNIPRDRNGEYQPQIIAKHQRNITGIEDKIISLYAAGLSTRDISEQIKELYEVEVSADLVSKITNKVIPLMEEWQMRPLEKIYPFVFLDAIHYKVREDGRIVNKACYVVIGINMDGYKEILGIWVGSNESSKFWLSVLNELKHRGVEDVLIFCVDGLNGFNEAIRATYPNANIQKCIIHQLRASTKYVSYKEVREFTMDLKKVYTAVTEDIGYNYLQEAKSKWGGKYPNAIKSWETNWPELSTFYLFPEVVRKIIYTTNIIEGVHRQFRKVTKTKATFPNDESLLKMLYLVSEKLTKKWTTRYKNWDMVLGQLAIIFEGRLDDVI